MSLISIIVVNAKLTLIGLAGYNLRGGTVCVETGKNVHCSSSLLFKFQELLGSVRFLFVHVIND